MEEREVALSYAFKALEFAANNYLINMKKLNTVIKGIYPNEEKKLVVVKWIDDSVTKVVCGEDDTFDVYVGVAIAVCKKFFGSNSQFRKTVDNLTKGAKK